MKRHARFGVVAGLAIGLAVAAIGIVPRTGRRGRHRHVDQHDGRSTSARSTSAPPRAGLGDADEHRRRPVRPDQHLRRRAADRRVQRLAELPGARRSRPAGRARSTTRSRRVRPARSTTRRASRSARRPASPTARTSASPWPASGSTRTPTTTTSSTTTTTTTTTTPSTTDPTSTATTASSGRRRRRRRRSPPTTTASATTTTRRPHASRSPACRSRRGRRWSSRSTTSTPSHSRGSTRPTSCSRRSSRARPTRFAAVFNSMEANPVGPIRSARTQDVNLLLSLNDPAIAYSGANAEVNSALQAAGFELFGEGTPGFFRRDDLTGAAQPVRQHRRAVAADRQLRRRRRRPSSTSPLAKTSPARR